MIREARRLDIDLNEVELRSDRRPARRALIATLDVFDLGRFPLLIHGSHGADRTGLPDTLYRMASIDVPPERAARGGRSAKDGRVPIRGIDRLHEPIPGCRDWRPAHG